MSPPNCAHTPPWQSLSVRHATQVPPLVAPSLPVAPPLLLVVDAPPSSPPGNMVESMLLFAPSQAASPKTAAGTRRTSRLMCEAPLREW